MDTNIAASQIAAVGRAWMAAGGAAQDIMSRNAEFAVERYRSACDAAARMMTAGSLSGAIRIQQEFAGESVSALNKSLTETIASLGGAMEPIRERTEQAARSVSDTAQAGAAAAHDAARELKSGTALARVI